MKRSSNILKIKKKLVKKPRYKGIFKLNIPILSAILIFLFIIIILLYSYNERSIRQLGIGENIQNATVSLDGKNVYIKLVGGNNTGITKINFIFTDSEGQEYSYETTEGAKEIEVLYKKTFWQWLFGKSPLAEIYDYETSAEDLGLENFNSAEKVSAVFEYKTEIDTVETPVLNTTKSTPATPPTTTPRNGGPSGPGPSSCVPSIDCSYYYNLNQCGIGLSDGCSNSLSCGECNEGFYCYTGETNNICINDSIICADSDGGKSYFVFGNVTLNQLSFSLDFCANKNLTEFYCYYNSSAFEIRNETFICAGECTSGKCAVSCNIFSECDDGVSCTVDRCDLGLCNNTANNTACNDGAYCNGQERCDALLGCQAGTALNVNDGISCTIDSCDETADTIIHTPDSALCNDGIECTEDLCNVLTGCVNNNLPAGTSCSAGVCDGNGNCVGCLDDGNCNPDGCYSGQYRDYYCSASSNCEYNDITQDESIANGNCDDGLDNDCADGIDTTDSGCVAGTFPTDYVSYWKLDTGIGGVVVDEVGNSDGSLENGAYIFNDPQRGSVLRLDGTNDYVDFPNTQQVIPDGSPFTISSWVYAGTSYSHTEYNLVVFGRTTNGIATYPYGLAMNQGSDGTTFRGTISNSSSNQQGNCLYVSTNTWTHLVVVFDGAQFTCFNNGVSGTPVTITLSGTYPKVPSSGDSGESMGRSYLGSNYFEGRIDDVMIYNRALSATEIQEIYEAQSSSGVPEVHPFRQFVELIRKLFSFG